jgi:hypothetical protein
MKTTTDYTDYTDDADLKMMMDDTDLAAAARPGPAEKLRL